MNFEIYNNNRKDIVQGGKRENFMYDKGLTICILDNLLFFLQIPKQKINFHAPH